MEEERAATPVPPAVETPTVDPISRSDSISTSADAPITQHHALTALEASGEALPQQIKNDPALEVTTHEAPASEAQAPEAPAPEAQAPEAPAPEAPVFEGSASSSQPADLSPPTAPEMQTDTVIPDAPPVSSTDQFSEHAVPNPSMDASLTSAQNSEGLPPSSNTLPEQHIPHEAHNSQQTPQDMQDMQNIQNLQNMQNMQSMHNMHNMQSMQSMQMPAQTHQNSSAPEITNSNSMSMPNYTQNMAPAHAPVMNNYMATSPAAHAPTPSGNLPTCHNCSTSTTPLWRRDEMGAVLCNACGLFLKLHGRPRPISLKTDVIKSRNRVKTIRTDLQKKKQQNVPGATHHNGHNFQSHDAANAAATAAALAAVRASQQKVTNGHVTSDSPISRTGTPNVSNVYDPNLGAFTTMDHFQSDGLQYAMPSGSPGRAPSPTHGDQQGLDAPQTHEQLIAANSSLKTRVSELDLINELYRGRLQQLEQDNQTADNYRHSAEMAAKDAATERALREDIQRQLDDSHRRENILKRRLDEMEQEIQEIKSQLKRQPSETDEPAAKRLKTEDHGSQDDVDDAEQLIALQAES